MSGAWFHHRWSIRTKSAALVVGYVLVLAGVFAGFTISLLRREAVEAHDRLQQTARIVAAEVDAYIESGRQRLAMVSRLPGMTYGLRSIQEVSAEGRIPPWTSLHYLFFKSPVFTGGVFLLDSTGKVLWTEPPGRTGLGRSLAGDSVVAAARARKATVVSHGLDADLLLDRPHVVVAVPIENPKGEIDGVLGGIIDLSAPEFTKIVGAAASTEGRFVDIVDQDNRVIGGSDPARLFQRSAETTIGDALLASAGLAQAPWQAVAGQSRSLALAEVWRFQRLLLALGVGLLVVAVAVGGPLINGFVRAIATLTAAAETIAHGDLSRPIVVDTRDHELATLAGTFEQMRVELDRSRRALEQRLEEREELIRLKEHFLANVSHELRTPLNVIIGYTDMLADDPPSAERSEFVAAIRHQSGHLFQLVSDLLTLSGLNTGRITLQVSPIQIANLFDRLKPVGQQLCASKDIDLVWDGATTLPIIETDPLRLEQVLTNLLTNAVKFTARGTITLRARFVPDTGKMVFEISDTGIGIPAPEIPHIFDEFRQVDGSYSRTYGGVGLGLALVQKVVALLEGDITVTSQVGTGSTFTLTLPLQPSTPGAAEDARRSVAA